MLAIHSRSPYRPFFSADNPPVQMPYRPSGASQAWVNALEAFLAGESSAGRSKNTLRAYRCDLMKFVREVSLDPGSRQGGRALDSEIAEFVARLGTGRDRSALKRQLLVLRSFLHHCMVTGFIERNPLDGCRVSLSPLRPLSMAALRSIITPILDSTCPDGGDVHQVARRDILLILLLLILGLRIAWLPGLMLSDIHRSGSQAVLHAPNGTDIPIPPVVLVVIAAYLSRRRAAHDRLLLNDDDDGPLTHYLLRLALHRISTVSGVSFNARILYDTHVHLFQNRAAHSELMDYLASSLSGPLWEQASS